MKTKTFLASLLLLVGLQMALAQSDAGSYPIETVRWDKVPAENREVIEQLFADMILVPESEEVKKFYISTHEVQESLWVVLMGEKEIIVAGDSTGSTTISGDIRERRLYSDATIGGKIKDTASVADIQAFIALLRKQTGKRFRLPTEVERLFAAECQLIDTIADAADKSGKGFHLALDTIAKAEQKMLVITAMDGTQTKYLLEGMPRVNIEKPYLIISAGGASVSLPLEQLQHIHYEKATDEATAIEEIKMLDEKNSRERIDFNNLPVNANVSIYTLDGKLLYNVLATQGKTLSLPLGSLQSGIYLVKVNDVTYKIQKP